MDTNITHGQIKQIMPLLGSFTKMIMEQRLDLSRDEVAKKYRISVETVCTAEDKAIAFIRDNKIRKPGAKLINTKHVEQLEF